MEEFTTWNDGGLNMDYQELFDHMSNAHGVILVESEIQDIERICTKEQIDYKARYEKCIKVIMRFDPGIITMYDL